MLLEQMKEIYTQCLDISTLQGKALESPNRNLKLWNIISSNRFLKAGQAHRKEIFSRDKYV